MAASDTANTAMPGGRASAFWTPARCDGGAQTITSIEVYAGPTLLGTLTVGEGLTCVDETQQACSGSVPAAARRATKIGSCVRLVISQAAPLIEVSHEFEQ